MINLIWMIILLIIIIIIISLHIGVKITFIYQKTERILEVKILKKIVIYTRDFQKKDNKTDGGRDLKKIIQLVKPCIRDLIIFAKEILRAIRIKKIENHIIIGLDSYSDTAKYTGIAWAILIIINSYHENIRLTAEPSFNQSTIEVNGIDEIEINLLKAAVPLYRLLKKKKNRELIKGVIYG